MAEGGGATQGQAEARRTLVRFEAVAKRFGQVVAVEALTLDIEQG